MAQPTMKLVAYLTETTSLVRLEQRSKRDNLK